MDKTYYTSIEQAKKLVELGLDPDTADMLFQLGEDKYADSIRVPLTKEHWEQMMPDINPCWSVGRLMDILPDPTAEVFKIKDTWNVAACGFGDTSSESLVEALVRKVEKLLKDGFITKQEKKNPLNM